jgi:predicted tellurium resistance membrane protein TerC
MNVKKILGFVGFGLAILGGYFWIINQISLSLIMWGVAIVIIIKLNRIKKKAKYNNKKKS